MQSGFFSIQTFIGAAVEGLIFVNDAVKREGRRDTLNKKYHKFKICCYDCAKL